LPPRSPPTPHQMSESEQTASALDRRAHSFLRRLAAERHTRVVLTQLLLLLAAVDFLPGQREESKSGIASPLGPCFALSAGGGT
jgi:hypothetical protein